MSDRSDDTGQKPEVSGSGGPAQAREEPDSAGPAQSPETSGDGPGQSPELSGARPSQADETPDAAPARAAGESSRSTERDDDTDRAPEAAEPAEAEPGATAADAAAALPMPEKETGADPAEPAALPVTEASPTAIGPATDAADAAVTETAPADLGPATDPAATAALNLTDDTPTAIAPAVEDGDGDDRTEPLTGAAVAPPGAITAPAPTEPPPSSAATPSTAPTSPTSSRFSTSATGAIIRVHSMATVADHTALLDRPGGGAFLTARGLTAIGRQGPIFTDVHVTARLGQLVAVCGDGGDGRSSLLLALTGRFGFQHGTLEVDGQTKPGQIRRRFTIAQAGPPIRFEPYATVGACIKETVTVSNGAATRANISAWLDRLAVGVDSGDTFGFLPRIDQIRFAIACAAAGRTPAIAVDDADTGLDTRGSARVFEALRSVADAGQLVIAACTRADPPADTVVDLRDRPPAAARPPRRERTRNGGLR